MKYLWKIATILLTTILFWATSCMLEEELPEPDERVNTFRSAMVRQVNNLRQQGCHCGGKYFPPAPTLQWNERLEHAAQRHADDMARNDHFDHTGTDGSSLGRRAKEAGYYYQIIGENIAFGHPTLKSVIESWRKSPGHCRNMMSPDFLEIGAAKREGYWVQTFGLPGD